MSWSKWKIWVDMGKNWPLRKKKFVEIRQLRIHNNQTITSVRKLIESIERFINTCFPDNINTELAYEEINKGNIKGRRDSLLYNCLTNIPIKSKIIGKFAIMDV